MKKPGTRKEPLKEGPGKRASNTSTATVADVAALARHLAERATLAREARALLERGFLDEGQGPRLLLQRHGEGVRPATIENILEVAHAIEALADSYDEEAGALLTLEVDAMANIAKCETASNSDGVVSATYPTGQALPAPEARRPD